MDTSELQPITVYGSNISYFTGKLENYFRLKGIDYRLYTDGITEATDADLELTDQSDIEDVSEMTSPPPTTHASSM